MRQPSTRRRFLESTALAGLALTAGCVAGSVTDRSGGTPTASTATHTTPESTPPASLDEWLADANGYDGDPVRFGPGRRPEIAVGEPVDGAMAFDPPVVEVPPMTNVRWNWTGHGGHNVVALDGTFDSGRTNAQSGTSYHYIFDEPGEYPFVSEPHREAGMKGAVVVAPPPTSGNDAVDEWVVAAPNFDGTIVDETDAATASIEVGVPSNDSHLAFDPPALRVDTGTTVEWRWTGEGGPHDVAFRTVDAGTDRLYTASGVHLSHTFEEAGTYRYACSPHSDLGMRGAIVVE